MSFHSIEKLHILIAFVFLTMLSCSNDFQITEGDVEIPIVYGVFSPKDTANFIRVERAFVDEKTSAYVLSKDVNQLYFNDIEVSLYHPKSNKTFVLTRVDGNTQGLVRQSGAFADAPNYLYKLKNPGNNYGMNGGDSLYLTIKRPDGSILTQASTVNMPFYTNEDITTPGIDKVMAFDYINFFNIALYGKNVSLEKVVGLRDVQIQIYYTERNGLTSIDTSVVWNVAKNIAVDENSTSFVYVGNGVKFYEFMAGALKADPAVTRTFNSLSLSIFSGGKEIKKYIEIGQANLGITSSGEIPVYSNLSNQGQGLFSGRNNLTRTDIQLAKPTLDSLKRGKYTKQLNFK